MLVPASLRWPTQALLLGMDAPSQEPFLVLLGKLSETNEVSTSQMSKVGLARPVAAGRQLADRHLRAGAGVRCLPPLVSARPACMSSI